jgi:predicted O-methyltransferase YrrM
MKTVFAKKYVFSIGMCSYLFLFGFIFPRNRLLISQICSHFGFTPPKKIVPRFGKVDLAFLIGGRDEPIRLEELTHVDGNVSVLELVAIATLVRRYEPENIFEIGTFDGRTTLNLALNSSESARVFTLDLPKSEAANAQWAISSQDMTYVNKDSSGMRFRNTDLERKINLLYGDSAVFDFMPYQNKIDFVFIDGAHSYEYVLNDTRAALKMLRNGTGVILWHDCVPDTPVVTALNELHAAHPELQNMRVIEGTTLACCVSCPTPDGAPAHIASARDK